LRSYYNLELKIRKTDRHIELNIVNGLFTTCVHLDKDKPLSKQLGQELNRYLKQYE